MPAIDQVVIIGLAGAEPKLAFERWRDDLPNLARLADSGLFGSLESCIPPLEIPAWTCMAAGKDPGSLGIYGPRGRRDWSYEDLTELTNLDVRQPRLWDMASRAGQPSVVVGVPQTFPMKHAPRCSLVTGPLTHSTDSPYTHPPELAAEIRDVVGQYLPDVRTDENDDDQQVLARIRQMTEQRFKLGRHLIRTRPWRLFWLVEIGPDRMQRRFWRDEAAPTGDAPGGPLDVVHDYYIRIDHEIGRLLELVDRDRTAVCVVSEHGAKTCAGGFCLNEWLIRRGLLAMRRELGGPRPFNLAEVDWSRTRMWADGGATGQCFLNLAGREPRGIVAPEESSRLCTELAEAIETLPGPDGNLMDSHAYRPQALYDELTRCPPDLIVTLGGLCWSLVSDIGNAELFLPPGRGTSSRSAPGLQGLYILSHASLPQRRIDASIYDLAPTVLELLGLKVPGGLRGSALPWR